VFERRQMYQFENMADNDESVIVNRPGKLISVTINQKGATGNKLSLWDGADANGREIAAIDTTVSLGNFDFNVVCMKGLFAKMATGTAANVTIIYD